MSDLNNKYRDQIETGTITNQVDNILRKMILRGELKGSQQIKERELSQMLNVSTTPIKEALRRLEAEGLIYRKPRVGTFVSDFSKEVMLQIVFMRSALDGVAAYFACKNAADEEIESLGGLIREMKDLTDRGADSSLISQKNECFHDEIRDCAKNDYLTNLIHNMHEIDQIFRELALTHKPAEIKRSFAEHEAIYQAIKKRDSAEAERLMNSHVRRVAEYVVWDTD